MKRTAIKKRSPRRLKVFKADPELKAFHDQVRALGCAICGQVQEVTLHHVHGGSVSPYLKRGGSQKMSDWAVMPLLTHYHTGDCGIDSGMGILTWENRFGNQLYFLQWVVKKTGVNIWEKMGIPEPASIARYEKV